MDYEWYEVVDNTQKYTQGDIIEEFPVPTFVEKDEYPFYRPANFTSDVVIMTQACDMQNDKTDYVTLCTLKNLEEYIINVFDDMYQDRLSTAIENAKETEGLDVFDISKGKYKNTVIKAIDSLKKGEYVNFYLLNKYDGNGVKKGARVVLLDELYQVPKKSLEKFLVSKDSSEKRLRLLPPYREHLSKAFANVFGRIGLPLDVNVSDLKDSLQLPEKLCINQLKESC